MLVLHAIWEPRSGPFVWAEGPRTSSGPGSGTVLLQGGHPGAAPGPELRRHLGELLPRTPPETLRLLARSLWLPARDEVPLPSPTLVSAGPGDLSGVGDIRLGEFRVGGVQLDPGTGLDLVEALLESRPTYRPGRSLAFLVRARDLARDLLRRGRTLPELEPDPWKVALLRWRPSFRLPGDRSRLAALTRSLPASFLSVAHLPLAGAPATRTEQARKSRTLAIVEDLFETLAQRRLGAAPPLVSHQDPTRRAWTDLACGGSGLPEDELPDAQEIRRLRQWRQAFEAPAAQVYRLRLRLQETPAGASPFELRSFLGVRGNPELALPTARVLQEPESYAGDLATHPPGFMEWTRGRLEELAGDLPSLGPLPRGGDSASLSVGEAETFLERLLPRLRREGHEVEVPGFWEEAAREHLSTRIRPGHRPPASTGPSRLGLDQLVRFDWQIALDGAPLTRDEIREAAAASGELVQVRGRWIRLRKEERRALARIPREDREGPVRSGPLVQWLRLQAGLEEVPKNLPPVEEDSGSDPSLAELLGTQGPPEVPEAPTGLRGSLRPYQARGVAWMATLDQLGLGACLADDMGLGKTIQVLALLLLERTSSSPPPGTTLLVCPTSLLGNWEHEAARFAPSLRLYTHHGPQRLQGRDFEDRLGETDLVLTSYALLSRDQALLGSPSWHRVVLDEAQNIKNPDTAQARAVRELKAHRRLGLTGTPVENRLVELWSLMRFLNPGLLGSRGEFQRRFVHPIEKLREEAPARMLRGLVGPFLLRRRKSDPDLVPELPEKLERTEYCNLSPEQAGLYQQEVEAMLQRVGAAEGMARRGAVLASLTRLKQICNHPLQVLPPDRSGSSGERPPLEGRSGKLERLEDLLDSVLEAGERALCFTQYRRMGEILQRRLEERFGEAVPFLHGGTPRNRRDELVQDFQAGRGAPVLLLSLKAAGTGLNLTAANHVVHYDRWWNPAVEDQATDRAFRIGQRRDVMVHRLVCVGTLEEKVDRLLEEKRDLVDRVVQGGETWITELSGDELRSLVLLETS